MEAFNRLLNEYKNQYLQFLATGEESYKQAYTRVLEQIDETVSAKREAVDSEKKAMQHFAKSYAESNAGLAGLVDAADQKAQDAQQIHDAYVTSKNRYELWTESPSAPAKAPIDTSTGYAILLRVGIFLILLPILLFVGYLVPTGAYYGQQGYSIVSSPTLSSRS